MKKNNKGFTLVELIVVLVILAILAAILVPALLGYIDKAREGQYAEEAHSILVAAQGYETEQYAKKNGTFATTGDELVDYINKIVDPTNVSSITVAPVGSGSSHSAFTIATVDSVTFTSQDGKTGTMKFDGSTWTIETPFTK